MMGLKIKLDHWKYIWEQTWWAVSQFGSASFLTANLGSLHPQYTQPSISIVSMYNDYNTYNVQKGSNVWMYNMQKVANGGAPNGNKYETKTFRIQHFFGSLDVQLFIHKTLCRRHICIAYSWLSVLARYKNKLIWVTIQNIFWTWNNFHWITFWWFLTWPFNGPERGTNCLDSISVHLDLLCLRVTTSLTLICFALPYHSY